jgi:hypothetical protein
MVSSRVKPAAVPFFHHVSHMKALGFELGVPREKPALNRLSYDMTKFNV